MLQLIPDMAVNKVGLGGAGERWPGFGDGDAADGNLSEIADQHGRLAGVLTRLNSPLTINDGDGRGVGFEFGLGGDAMPSAGRIDCRHL